MIKPLIHDQGKNMKKRDVEENALIVTTYGLLMK